MSGNRSIDRRFAAVEIGEEVRRLRIEQGFNVITMAVRLNITLEAYMKIETGEMLPSIMTFIRLSVILKAPCDLISQTLHDDIAEPSG